ncbi:hypothetical protein SteCoe_23111 [Stentor coeruleus]|uniref:Uncharacterized protein n=1 Tax=Stentor coeruleus TaxID=5963 RepID=A0A1R2BKM7_9CILI|nr:hypothetical protein SteCoe_23111 [Stentor coeruleus]
MKSSSTARKKFSKGLCSPILRREFFDNSDLLLTPNPKSTAPFYSTGGFQLTAWSLPQRVESNSPLAKALKNLKDKISGEAKLEKNIRKRSPEVDFFRQSIRMPISALNNKSRRIKWSNAQPEVSRRVSRKIILVGDNDVKEVEFIARKAYSKSALKYYKNS